MMPQRIVRTNGTYKNGGNTASWNNTKHPHKPGDDNNARLDERLSTLTRYWTGERTTDKVLPSPYVTIRQQCYERGILWEDPDFVPSYKLLPKKYSYSVVWLRPHEIVGHPKFASEAPWKSPIEMGLQGDLWLYLALTTLCTTPNLFERNIPIDQDFDHGYGGIFRFSFWQFGSWVEVCVDDRLPTCRGRPIGLFSSEHGGFEFWPALLEKAYAKLYGGYDRLRDGSCARAIQDFTGGIVQSFRLNSQERFLTYQVLNSAVPRSTLIIASILPDREGRLLKLRHGLTTHSAYDVTGLARVRDIGAGSSTIGETPLVRLRGPWGKGTWIGPWSERSIEWESLPDRDKEVLSVRTRADGEFWMSFVDFTRNFTNLELVHIGPDDWLVEPNLQPRKPWRAVLAKRKWRQGYNAGGGPDFPATTAMNPQFVVQIPRSTANKCHVVVAITQQYGGFDFNYTQDNRSSTNGKATKATFHAIGFSIYEAMDTNVRITPQYVQKNKPLDVTQHSVSREVATFFALPPGVYIIIPQTKLPNCEGRFLLRIFTDEISTIWEMNEDNSIYQNYTKDGYLRIEFPSEAEQILLKWRKQFPNEINAGQFRRLLLKTNWKVWMSTKPTLEVCKSLIMLRDSNISGRMSADDLPILLNMLEIWKAAFQKWVKGKNIKTSSYHMRGMLYEAGVKVSNKVLECLVLRFAKDSVVTSEAFVMALLRIHLAHERHSALDSKTRTNPLSLEEMILMTIYA